MFHPLSAIFRENIVYIWEGTEEFIVAETCRGK
jgi:hypothetical protein